MSVERLLDIDAVRVTFTLPPPDMWPPLMSLAPPLVERGYVVQGVTKVSDAEIWFHAPDNHYIHIKDGKGTVGGLILGLI